MLGFVYWSGHGMCSIFREKASCIVLSFFDVLRCPTGRLRQAYEDCVAGDSYEKL